MLLSLSCGTTSKFISGEEAFNRKHYFKAAELFKSELNKYKGRNDSWKKLFLIGESFRFMEMTKESIVWYRKAISIGASEIVYFKYMSQLKKLEKYNEAIEILEKVKQKFGNSTTIQREISICKQAEKWKNNALKNTLIRNLNFNSEYSEFVSDFYQKDYLIISSDRHYSSNEKYGWTGRYFYNLLIGDITGYSEISSFSNDINKKYNEASACFNSTNNEMFFVRCGKEKDINNCIILSSLKIDDSWVNISKLPFMKSGVNYISPCLIDDNTLFFASDDPAGIGGFDIYFSVRNEEKWSIPTLLPKFINTTGNEKFITTWKGEIYFSSDYLPGMGGLDIFSTTLDSNGIFTPPHHLKYPINSGGDDFYLLKINDTLGFFSSSRIGGIGHDDIYEFVEEPLHKIDSLDTELTKEIKKGVKSVYLAFKVSEKVYMDEDDPNSRVLGNRSLSDASLIINDSEIIKTDNNGTVIKKVDFDSTYNVIIGKNGFLSTSLKVRIKIDSAYTDKITTINRKIVLEKLFLGKEIILSNIYYDYDDYKLRNDAFPALNNLFKILKNNPSYEIKIGSHTDCRGELEYNNSLSSKRAQSVVNYLTKKGITKNRLSSVGYGETKLLESCECDKCSETQHQKNRRTTFELIE